jgi:hypothetical protein
MGFMRFAHQPSGFQHIYDARGSLSVEFQKRVYSARCLLADVSLDEIRFYLLDHCVIFIRAYLGMDFAWKFFGKHFIMVARRGSLM